MFDMCRPTYSCMDHEILLRKQREVQTGMNEGKRAVHMNRRIRLFAELLCEFNGVGCEFRSAYWQELGDMLQ